MCDISDLQYNNVKRWLYVESFEHFCLSIDLKFTMRRTGYKMFDLWCNTRRLVHISHTYLRKDVQVDGSPLLKLCKERRWEGGNKGVLGSDYVEDGLREKCRLLIYGLPLLQVERLRRTV